VPSLPRFAVRAAELNGVAGQRGPVGRGSSLQFLLWAAHCACGAFEALTYATRSGDCDRKIDPVEGPGPLR
jgi:hypothetical protein